MMIFTGNTREGDMSTAMIDKPSRRTIEMLFRDLFEVNRRISNRESSEVYAQMDALEEQLKRSPKYRRLRDKYDKLSHSERDRDRVRTERIRAVRNRYLAEGLTPAVQKLVNALVKEFSK